MKLRPWIQPKPDWLDQPSVAQSIKTGAVAFVGLALYGFSVGFWRDPLMACYVAIKIPLLVALTLGANGLLNGLLAILLGSGLGFRQSWLALLSAFALAGLILGSLAPVTLLMAWNAPPPDSDAAVQSHASYLVVHTLLIAIAGIASNIHLLKLLAAKAPNPSSASITLVAWLAGNCFLGAQFSWILRPFFGSPQLDVQFLRDHPMRGNFYEAFWKSIDQATHGNGFASVVIILFLISIPIAHAIQQIHHNKTTP